MIKVDNIAVYNFSGAFRGLRNPMNSWDKSDSHYCYETDCNTCSSAFIDCDIYKEHSSIICENGLVNSKYMAYPEDYVIGPADMELAQRMIRAGASDSKFLRQIFVSMDITAPLYWWKEMDQYKVGTTTDSCSTMHKISAKRFEREDFSIEHLENCDEHHWMVCMDNVIASLNVAREKYLETKYKKYWWQMIQLLPSSYNQMRTWTGSYANLRNIFFQRKSHKLDEWREFCEKLKYFPYGKELITYDFA